MAVRDLLVKLIDPAPDVDSRGLAWKASLYFKNMTLPQSTVYEELGEVMVDIYIICVINPFGGLTNTLILRSF